MVGMINKVLILDMLILIIGLLVLYTRPFGWDMTHGLMIIVVCFFASVILFLLKMKIVERQITKK